MLHNIPYKLITHKICLLDVKMINEMYYFCNKILWILNNFNFLFRKILKHIFWTNNLQNDEGGYFFNRGTRPFSPLARDSCLFQEQSWKLWNQWTCDGNRIRATLMSSILFLRGRDGVTGVQYLRGYEIPRSIITPGGCNS